MRWRKYSHREDGVSVKASTEWTSSCLVGRRYGGQRNQLLRGVAEASMHVVGLVGLLDWVFNQHWHSDRTSVQESKRTRCL